LNELDKLVSNSAHGLLNIDKLNVKIDSYVLETNVHVPSDVNLLWDASRKSIELVGQLYNSLHVAGKHTDTGLNAAVAYLSLAEQLSHKLTDSIALLQVLLILPDFNFMK
jgi:hypothetical protein